MNIVVLGLSLSSSWGNGHATTYRALLRALSARHSILFLEREQPWYAANRDLPEPDFCTLRFYHDVNGLQAYREDIEVADAVMIGSFVADGPAIAEQIAGWTQGVLAFYDIDTPVTLAKLGRRDYTYISPKIIPLFDVYLSFTGGPTLGRLSEDFGAKRAAALYCGVDASRYRPMTKVKRWAIGYLGTYSEDRQPTLDQLLIETARRRPDLSFVVAGPQYPSSIAWPSNVERIEHLPPDKHAAFYSAQDWTLNITRGDMISAGYSPSVRLFEASACGVPIISDVWSGIDTFFTPGAEILLAHNTSDVLLALDLPMAARESIAAAARARCLSSHTAEHRAADLERIFQAGP